MKGQHRKPSLVCLNNGRDTLTRYAPKPNGGFYSEAFEITDRPRFNASLTIETIENVRLGKMKGQEEIVIEPLVDQPEQA